MYPLCPQCGSNKVRKFGKGFMFSVFFFGGGLVSWLGLLFIPFLFIGLLFVFGSPFAFLLPPVYQCQECKKSYAHNKKLSV